MATPWLGIALNWFAFNCIEGYKPVQLRCPAILMVFLNIVASYVSRENEAIHICISLNCHIRLDLLHCSLKSSCIVSITAKSLKLNRNYHCFPIKSSSIGGWYDANWKHQNAVHWSMHTIYSEYRCSIAKNVGWLMLHSAVHIVLNRLQ